MKLSGNLTGGIIYIYIYRIKAWQDYGQGSQQKSNVSLDLPSGFPV